VQGSVHFYKLNQLLKSTACRFLNLSVITLLISALPLPVLTASDLPRLDVTGASALPLPRVYCLGPCLCLEQNALTTLLFKLVIR